MSSLVTSSPLGGDLGETCNARIRCLSMGKEDVLMSTQLESINNCNGSVSTESVDDDQWDSSSCLLGLVHCCTCKTTPYISRCRILSAIAVQLCSTVQISGESMHPSSADSNLALCPSALGKGAPGACTACLLLRSSSHRLCLIGPCLGDCRFLGPQPLHRVIKAATQLAALLLQMFWRSI